jgi:hypothetical protein
LKERKKERKKKRKEEKRKKKILKLLHDSFRPSVPSFVATDKYASFHLCFIDPLTSTARIRQSLVHFAFVLIVDW